MKQWEQFLDEQEKVFGEDTTTHWLRSLQILSFDACNLFLEAKDSFHILWFEEHIRPKLKNLINNNRSPIKVHIGLKGQHAEKKKSKKKKQPATPLPNFSLSFEKLDPNFSFENFSSTLKNEPLLLFLKTLETHLKEQKKNQKKKPAFSLPSDFPNPIYLYGDKGAGKTHLAMAIGKLLTLYNYKVLYANGETFCDHFIKAIRAENIKTFRKEYREADLLILDDAHLLQKKAATQEEFFHTFNTLHSNNKLLILCSNSIPHQLTHIEERLISRFQWGISFRVEGLSKKELLPVIKKRASAFHFALSDSAALFLIDTFSSSPKALIHALQTLVFRLEMEPKKAAQITPSYIQKTLHDLIEQEEKSSLTLEEIISSVASCYDLSIEDLLKKSQSRNFVQPRKLAMYLCRELLKLPYMTIGDAFHKDHSTVITACRSIKKLLQQGNSSLIQAKIAVEKKLQTRPQNI